MPVPTVFELAKQAGFGTAAFFSKSKFRHLERPGSLDHAQSPDGSEHWLATRTVADASDYLKHRRPGLLFVHIAEPDYAGHALGWMSFLYGWAVRRADGAVAQVLAAADQAFGSGQYTVIVTSDHGGHDREHGSREPRDMTIPWIIWGQGVLQGQQLPAGIRTMDTAATVLWLLGIPVPDWWVGAPVPGAFTRAAQVAAAGAQPVKQGLAGSASP
ncbi:MAG: alkaline phosphatase [Gemmatimonadetes bacterium]|nr:alkaline phosphatase [Gemmatimonadota bacterium]